MPTKKELYSLTKEMLFAKFDGLCAFCGHELGQRWHIWEIESSKTIVTVKGDIVLGNEGYNNKLPACVSCNATRINGSKYRNDGLRLDIEQFRSWLQFEYEFLQDNTYYKKMLRYGIIKETGNNIIFHFERQ